MQTAANTRHKCSCKEQTQNNDHQVNFGLQDRLIDQACERKALSHLQAKLDHHQEQDGADCTSVRPKNRPQTPG